MNAPPSASQLTSTTTMWALVDAATVSTIVLTLAVVMAAMTLRLLRHWHGKQTVCSAKCDRQKYAPALRQTAT